MAFTTIEGTNGAPWTFEGTSGVDQVAVITGSQTDAAGFNFVANGEGDNDVINWNGIRSVTIRGGDGDDTITNNIALGATVADFVTNSFINGNAGDDVIGNNQFGIAATISTVVGGQGADALFLGNLQSSLVNGNIGEDQIFLSNINAPGNIVNWNNSTVNGGQSDDSFEIVSRGAGGANINGTVIAGQLGNDSFGIEIDTNFAGSIVDGGEGDDLIDASGRVYGGGVLVSLADLNLVGGLGDDSIYGGAGDDDIAGGDQDDWLAGSGGSDVIEGGKGNDVIVGAFYDGITFVGDGEGDTLSGGTGANRFVARAGSTAVVALKDVGVVGKIDAGDTYTIVNGADIITDWNSGAGNNVFDTGFANTLAVVNAARMSFNAANNVNNQNYAVRGNYSEDAAGVGTFIVGANVGGVVQGDDIAVFSLQGNAISNFTILAQDLTSTLTANQFVNV